MSTTSPTMPATALTLTRARPAAAAHLQFVDNLRILLTTLVILHHLSIIYGASGGFMYEENIAVSLASAIPLTLFVAINASFFMGFFFLIAGFVTPASVDRKGVAVYLKDRVKRLAIPLLLYEIAIQPLVIYISLGAQGRTVGSFAQFYPFYMRNLKSWADGPMWFVEVLLVFGFGYAIWRVLTRNAGAPVAREERAPGNAALALYALAVGLLTFAVRLAWPVDVWAEPLHIQPANQVQYTALFIAGIIAYRRGWFAGLTQAQGRFWTRVAIGLVPAFLVIAVAGGALEGDVTIFQGGLSWQALAYALWGEFMCVAMIIALLVGFRERFNHQNETGEAIAGSTYAVYVFHPLVLVPLAVALIGLPIGDGGLKFLLVAPLAVALCYLVGSIVKRLPLAREIF